MYAFLIACGFFINNFNKFVLQVLKSGQVPFRLQPDFLVNFGDGKSFGNVVLINVSVKNFNNVLAKGHLKPLDAAVLYNNLFQLLHTQYGAIKTADNFINMLFHYWLQRSKQSDIFLIQIDHPNLFI
ncbi:hypothetical protein D3C73_1308290 [compost metagenome]